jgi:shikimate kinase
MKGEGQAIAHGAVTILNAFATGKGGALGIDLWTRARVALREGSGEIVGRELDSRDQNRLSVTVARRIIEHFGYDRRVSGEVTTKSNIPSAVGLKSSSAAANAVALATASALGESIDDDTLLRIGIEVSMECGASLTGAYDDSYASYHGGAVITDNELRKVEKNIRVPNPVELLILVPERKRFTGSLDRSRFSPIRNISEIAYEQALKGKIWDAMTLNGLAVSSILGEDPNPALCAIQAGALGSGQRERVQLWWPLLKTECQTESDSHSQSSTVRSWRQNRTFRKL